jgi:transcriptional regulator with XRE-family HTH domain
MATNAAKKDQEPRSVQGHEPLGKVLRSLRNQRGWTLAEMAQRTGLPVSTISKLETDKVSLSYDKLLKLCEGLGIDIAELFASEPAAPAPSGITGRRSVARAGEGYTIDTQNYFHIYPAADLLNKRFVPIIAEIHARSLEECEMIRHPGEEYTYVVEGAVELHTDLYAPTRLETGDSIYFDSGMAHGYIAVAPGPCRLISVCSTSESSLQELMGGQRKPDAAQQPAAKVRKLARKPRA